MRDVGLEQHSGKSCRYAANNFTQKQPIDYGAEKLHFLYINNRFHDP